MFIFYHLEVLEGSFADVDDTWMRDPLVITFLSLSLFLSSLPMASPSPPRPVAIGHSRHPPAGPVPP